MSLNGVNPFETVTAIKGFNQRDWIDADLAAMNSLVLSRSGARPPVISHQMNTQSSHEKLYLSRSHKHRSRNVSPRRCL